MVPTGAVLADHDREVGLPIAVEIERHRPIAVVTDLNLDIVSTVIVICVIAAIATVVVVHVAVDVIADTVRLVPTDDHR